jgi:hypothetical protein
LATELSVREQATMFALMVVARPVTNRELRQVAGLEVEAAVRRHLNNGPKYILSVKRGTTTTHELTEAGLAWCAEALVDGRPQETKFPGGVLYAVLEGVGRYLATHDVTLEGFFTPDLDTRIRAAYSELTVRRPGAWIKLTALRRWLDDLPAAVIDAELDRMIESPDVRLMAEPSGKVVTAADDEAAVVIGGERRHLIRIGQE